MLHFTRGLLIISLVVMLSLISWCNVFAQSDGYKTWRSDMHGITLEYPETWSLNETPEKDDVPCILEAPVSVDEPGSGGDEAFRPFLMPVVIGAGYFEDIGTLSGVWLDIVEIDWPDFEMKRKTPLETADGHPGCELRYTVTDKNNRIQWAVWLVLTEEKKKAWVIGYCASDGFDAYYETAKEIFKRVEFAD